MGNRKRHTTVYKKNRKTQKHSSQKKSKKNRKNSRRGKNKRRDTKRNYMKGGQSIFSQEELDEIHEQISTLVDELEKAQFSRINEILDKTLPDMHYERLVEHQKNKYQISQNIPDDELKLRNKLELIKKIKERIISKNTPDTLSKYLKILRDRETFIKEVNNIEQFFLTKKIDKPLTEDQSLREMLDRVAQWRAEARARTEGED